MTTSTYFPEKDIDYSALLKEIEFYTSSGKMPYMITFTTTGHVADIRSYLSILNITKNQHEERLIAMLSDEHVPSYWYHIHLRSMIRRLHNQYRGRGYVIIYDGPMTDVEIIKAMRQYSNSGDAYDIPPSFDSIITHLLDNGRVVYDTDHVSRIIED